MYKNFKIAALVPAYNEEKLIGKTIEGMPDFVDHIIVVDDCSKDKTSEVVEGHFHPMIVEGSQRVSTAVRTRNSRVVLIRHKKNTGLGGAIRDAVKEARELGCNIGVVMAGDNQMDPAYLPSLLDPICDMGYDLAKANRFYSSDGYTGMPKYRIFGSIALAFLTRIASGYWHLMDPQNGYVAYGPRVLENINFEKITTGYALENDILINLNILNMRMVEVPVKAVYGEEVSTMKMWKIIPSFSVFLSLGFFRRIFKKYVLRGFHPIALLMFSGSFLFFGGLSFGLVEWAHTIKTGVPATTGTVMLAALPFLMGFEMLLWSLILDIQEEPK